MITFTADKPDVQKAIRALRVDARRKIVLVLQQVGLETMAYLRSLTTEMRPPAAGKDNSRRAHPGHWADVTGQLAGSYSWEVEEHGDEVVLVLRNDAAHAIWVEMREGFFVLSGVADPGGPVQQALERIIPRVAPGWQVRFG